MTSDPHGGAERLPALLDDDELSPELALVDPDVGERARDALPDITLTEIRLSLSIKVQQMPPPSVPQPVHEPVAAAVPAPAPALPPPPALVRTADPPPPPSYEEIRRVFHEPRFGPQRWRRSVLAAVVVLGVAAGVALALPRALDGPTSLTSADRRSSAARHPTVPAAHRAKTKKTRKAKPTAHKKAAPRPSRHARHAHKAKPTPTTPTATPPSSSRHVTKRKHKPSPVRPRPRVIPDFVWAPVKSANGYLVEFRTGSKLALRVRTRAPRLHVSAAQLRRGHYRWLVWVIGTSGSPIGKPLVDSTVTVR